MRKENLVTATNGEITAPLTRARAAAIRAHGQLPPLRAPVRKNDLQNFQGNPNNSGFNENSNACDDPFHNRKRKAVLQDITNFYGKCSQKNCSNAAKVQGKNNKLTGKARVKIYKVASSVALESSQFQAASETKILQGTVERGTKSKMSMSSMVLEENVPLQLSTMNKCVVDELWLENQSFGMPSQPRSPLEKGGLSGEMVTSSNLDIIDIDKDLKEPRLCSNYAAEIYSNLRVAELVRRPSPTFMQTMRQVVIQNMRRILVDWLVEVSEGFKLASNTLYLTVYLIDWFLNGNHIEGRKIQLLGITCMLLASKYEEGHAPQVEEFCLITGNTYGRKEVLELEIRVLKYLGFQLFAPTAKVFLRRFLQAAQASFQTPSLELEYLANYLAELTLIDHGFLNFLPSAVAASAVFLARWTLDQSNHPWNPTLEYYTSYKASDLKVIVLAIQDLQLNNNGCSLSAIRNKYRQQKFKSVVDLSSQKLPETLFGR